MSLPYNKNLIPKAKELRRNMTKQEKRIWYDFLSKYPIRFQRQKTIDHFIVDFYCHRAKLVIEIDGGQHYTEEGLEYDEARTEILNAYGLQVIRFSNSEIEKNFNDVCNVINEIITQTTERK
jgi:very-short-patch-repair endonuclease